MSSKIYEFRGAGRLIISDPVLKPYVSGRLIMSIILAVEVIDHSNATKQAG